MAVLALRHPHQPRPAPLHAALSHAASVLRIERTLGIDPELSLNRWLAGQHALALALSDYYDNAHFVVTLGLLGLLWWRRADIYPSLRNALVATNLIGFAVFWLWPMAPPRMLPGNGFTDVVAASHAFGSWHTGASPQMPISMRRCHRCISPGRCGARGDLAPDQQTLAAGAWACTRGITAFAVMATGNHFLLDVLAGALTAALSFAIIETTSRGAASGQRRASRPLCRLTRDGLSSAEARWRSVTNLSRSRA